MKAKKANKVKKEKVISLKEVRKQFLAIPSCECGHPEETHYGGLRGHCNASGCACLEMK
jgi:hypothetical protein